ncbi:MAG: amino acid racemase [Desulfurococcales archaeon]|nr:amino acid racemase [Desulfurococcales archaeon]
MPKRLGVIGGLSPYSTIIYYKAINEAYKQRTGSYPELVIDSVSISKVCPLVKEGKLDELAEYLSESARRLERAGADLFMIAANTPHIVASKVASATSMEFVHILDAVYRDIEKLGIKRVGLLATSGTVRHRLYQDYLEEKGLEVIVPSEQAQKKLDEIIDKIVDGYMSESMSLIASSIASGLISKGAQALVLGCTELPLVFQRIRTRIPVIDSVKSHVEYVVEKIMD